MKSFTACRHFTLGLMAVRRVATLLTSIDLYLGHRTKYFDSNILHETLISEFNNTNGDFLRCFFSVHFIPCRPTKVTHALMENVQVDDQRSALILCGYCMWLNLKWFRTPCPIFMRRKDKDKRLSTIFGIYSRGPPWHETCLNIRTSIQTRK